MAKKSKEKAPQNGDTVIRAIRAGVEKLMEKHYDEIESFSRESPSKKVKVGFTAMLDYSAPDISVIVAMGFTKAVKDKVSMHVPDKNQGRFSFVDDLPEDDENDKDLETGAELATAD